MFHTWMFARFPILTWLPKYSWPEHTISDIAAGLTVAVMHIPQGSKTL